jgi:hypothetical protein
MREIPECPDCGERHHLPNFSKKAKRLKDGKDKILKILFSYA